MKGRSKLEKLLLKIAIKSSDSVLNLIEIKSVSFLLPTRQRLMIINDKKKKNIVPLFTLRIM